MSTDTFSDSRPVDAPATPSPDERQPHIPLDAASRRDAYLVVRVGGERFALPLHSVAEALDPPVVVEAAGVSGQRLLFVHWRGRRLPLVGARAPFGVDAVSAGAVALVLADPVQPLAVTVDELCDVRELPPSALRPFVGRHDVHRVVRSVALDGDTLIAVVAIEALRAAVLAGGAPAAAAAPHAADVMARAG